MTILILILFIALFFILFKLKGPFFNGKKRWLQVELGLISIITIIQLIISGIGMTLGFILFWGIVAFGCYYVYEKYNQKIGFIMVNFSFFFSISFLILQVWIFGTD
ncbi:MAG: hypothetical protein ACRCST_14515 [Turicibacter sp.]